MDALISVVLWNADDPPMEVVVCEMDAEFLTGSFVIMFILYHKCSQMPGVLRIYSQIYPKLLQTKKIRAFYVFIKVYLYEHKEIRSGHCLPLRVCIINQVIAFSLRQIPLVLLFRNQVIL